MEYHTRLAVTLAIWIAALKQTIADLEAEVAPLKAQVAEDVRTLKVLKAERVRVLAELDRDFAEFDKQIEAQQQKLAVLNILDS